MNASQVGHSQIADEAFSDSDLLAELTLARNENERLKADVKAAQADHLAAELLKWRRCYEAAVRAQAEAMNSAKRSDDNAKWAKRQLRVCGDAIGEKDLTKVAAAVCAFVRVHTQAK